MEAKPYNAFAKSYIKSNIFLKEEFLFSSVKTEDSLLEDINDWTHLKENIKTNDKFTKLMTTAAPVIS